ncbi:MAG: class I SAM-dependent methyltransferase [Sulfuricurvum sp.]|uniref:class I SAM-dependent methyltransferase n=1 Tax=Sulfuricurvum sp. TaxID=2025608 RepID=UPI00262F8CB2|nr:class I SAM-dependent methyltransferase [Sulfuricurvum sp.]MDD5161091.1 class I SAM-dependent methyltransferase [Sulfuricurvum sp.]
MANTQSFDQYTEAYEQWFEKNPHIYADEVQTLKQLVGNAKNGLDIGMGSGQFALPLGIDIGIEPSQQMRAKALSKGLHPVDGIAENLPFEDEEFDFALMITVICFVDDPLKAIQEAFRVICKNGLLIIGIIDKNSSVGRQYEENKESNRFYKQATFFSIEEIKTLARQAGFSDCSSTGVKMMDDSFVFIQCFKS